MKQIPNSARNKRVSNPRQRKKQHLLDVKLRESKERARRYGKVASFIFKTVVFVALVVGAYVGGKEALRRFVWENPDYFVHEINFTTDGALTREQVLNTAGIAEELTGYFRNVKAPIGMKQHPKKWNRVLRELNGLHEMQAAVTTAGQ